MVWSPNPLKSEVNALLATSSFDYVQVKNPDHTCPYPYRALCPQHCSPRDTQKTLKTSKVFLRKRARLVNRYNRSNSKLFIDPTE